MELTHNEKKLLALLGPLKETDPASLAEALDTKEESVLQFAHLLSDRGLAEVDRSVESIYSVTDEGRIYAEKGLPERQLYESFEKEIPMAELTKNPLARIGIGQMRKKGWITIERGLVIKEEDVQEGEDERTLDSLARGDSASGGSVKDLIKRGLVDEEEVVSYRIRITPEGEALLKKGLDFSQEVDTLTRDQIISGDWRSQKLRKYTVSKLPRKVYPGKIHPYQRVINEMRGILLSMGFTELYGEIVQSAFWNFDALFQPQDHPAREMQDTFYLKEDHHLPEGFERVRDMHQHGGTTSSTGWGGRWSVEKARQCVLRTHTTPLTIQHLALHPEPPVKAFSINRVYRRETIDPTHTPEFEQLEGIVMDKGVNFRNLLGYLNEFYHRMGFENVRFRPGYFPYTEPSVEPEVYVDGLGWVELGGAGIFRQEVTSPWNIRYPVLAWGLGVSRVAMLKLGLKDLRMLYRSDIEWVRDSPSYDREHIGSGGN